MKVMSECMNTYDIDTANEGGRKHQEPTYFDEAIAEKNKDTFMNVQSHDPEVDTDPRFNQEELNGITEDENDINAIAKNASENREDETVSEYSKDMYTDLTSQDIVIGSASRENEIENNSGEPKSVTEGDQEHNLAEYDSVLATASDSYKSEPDARFSTSVSEEESEHILGFHTIYDKNDVYLDGGIQSYQNEERVFVKTVVSSFDDISFPKEENIDKEDNSEGVSSSHNIDDNMNRAGVEDVDYNNKKSLSDTKQHETAIEKEVSNVDGSRMGDIIMEAISPEMEQIPEEAQNSSDMNEYLNEDILDKNDQEDESDKNEVNDPENISKDRSTYMPNSQGKNADIHLSDPELNSEQKGKDGEIHQHDFMTSNRLEAPSDLHSHASEPGLSAEHQGKLYKIYQENDMPDGGVGLSGSFHSVPIESELSSLDGEQYKLEASTQVDPTASKRSASPTGSLSVTFGPDLDAVDESQKGQTHQEDLNVDSRCGSSVTFPIVKSEPELSAIEESQPREIHQEASRTENRLGSSATFFSVKSESNFSSVNRDKTEETGQEGVSDVSQLNPADTLHERNEQDRSSGGLFSVQWLCRYAIVEYC